MPTDPIAALSYVCLLLPGIAFVWRYEGHNAVVKRSAFRETAAVVIASAASLVAVFVIQYLLAFVFEPARNMLRQFFIDPTELFKQNSQLFFGVVLGNLAMAVSFGALFGSAFTFRLLRQCRQMWLKLTRRQSVSIERGQSAWNTAFERFPHHKVIVGVHLKSGAWTQGVLDSYSRTGDESPDRAFTLTGEIWYQSSGGNAPHRLESHSVVIVQATEIEYLTVGYEEVVGDLDSSGSTL